MAIYVKQSSTWREIQQPYVKTSGVWREITNQSVKNAGTWREVFPAKGELYTWGYNSRTDVSPLGINVTGTNRCTPVTTFAGGTNWKQVSCGRLFGAGIKTDGTLWTWGYNTGYDVNLGTNDTTSKNTPVTTFAGGTNWKQVSTGKGHTAAIKTDGTLWLWGQNSNGPLLAGQIGNNTNNSNVRTPVTTFAGGTNWKQVSCGGFHTAAIKTDGTLWTWGDNGYGQLGTNNTQLRCTPVTTFAGGTNWAQVSCGYSYTTAIKTDGTLWTWGRNVNGMLPGGQLGTNDTTTRSTPVTTFAGGTNWKQVSAKNHTAAIKTDGTLWLWGFNGYGQLGTNDTTTRSTPVTTFAGGTNWKQVSTGSGIYNFFNFSAAIKTDGTLWTWGDNGNGQLGINNTSQRNTPVTTFAGGTNWKQVSCGFGDSGPIIAAIK